LFDQQLDVRCDGMQMAQATGFGFGFGLFFCWQQMGQSILTITFPGDLLGLCYSHQHFVSAKK
jgi:hypothetical protein